MGQQKVQPKSQSSSRLDAALPNAKRGWAVLPLHWVEGGKCSCGIPDCGKPGKHPLTTNGLKDATLDEQQIREWWQEYPQANIAIATGSPSSITVLDIDPRHGGDASLRQLEKQHGPLPDSARVRTGGGGEHLYFLAPPDVRIRSRVGWLPGIDVRAEGAYVVGAGSTHASGKPYLWERGKTPEKTPLPPCPNWLLEMLSESERLKAEETTLIREGKRNARLTSLGGTMRARGMSGEAVEAALLEENRVRCKPPLDDAEVQRIATSVAQYPPRKNVQAKQSVEAPINLPFRTGAEVERETPAKVEWLAEPWVAAGVMTELDGKVKSAGKTTFALAMTSAVLRGAKFMNKPTKKTPVVYLTEQNPTSFREAMKRAALLGRADFAVLFWKDVVRVPWPVIVDSAVKECKKRGAQMLVVDTLTQFAGLEGESENNAGSALADMRPLQEAAAAGIAVLPVRHERKTGGIVSEAGRGSSAYAGVADIVLSLRRQEGNHPRNVRLLQTISRFDETPAALLIELTDGGGFRSIGEPGDAAIERQQSDILAAIPNKKKDAQDIQALHKSTRMSRARLQRRLEQLLNEGKVRRTGKGAKGDPVRYFKD